MIFLLRVRPWQLFMLTFGVHYPADISANLLTKFALHDVTAIARLLSIAGTLGFIVGILWVYEVVLAFYNRVPSRVLVNISAFKICIYTLILNVTLRGILFKSAALASIFIYLFGWIAMVCFLYVAYHAANVLVSVEEQREIKPHNLIGPTLGFLLSPIGIWFLQPRIIKLFNNQH